MRTTFPLGQKTPD